MGTKRFQMVVAALAIGLGALFGFSGQAYAGAYAFSLTEVSNFLVTCQNGATGCPITGGGTSANGTTIDVTNFSVTPNFTNTQTSTAHLDASTLSGSPIAPVPNGTIQQACLGNCPATLTNNPFAFFGVVPPLSGVPPPTNANFTDVANQLTGAIISGTGVAAGATANSVAQTQLLGAHITPLSNTNVTLAAGFVFTLSGAAGTSEQLGISFSALEQLVAALDPAGKNSTASSSFEISISCADNNGCGGTIVNGQTVFDWSPDGTSTLHTNLVSGSVTLTGCNLQSSISSNFNGQATEVNTGTCTFAALFTLLEGVQYNFSIVQKNDVSALSVVAVPEPKSVALLAVGLLGLGFFARRLRRRT